MHCHAYSLVEIYMELVVSLATASDVAARCPSGFEFDVSAPLQNQPRARHSRSGTHHAANLTQLAGAARKSSPSTVPPKKPKLSWSKKRHRCNADRADGPISQVTRGRLPHKVVALTTTEGSHTQPGARLGLHTKRYTCGATLLYIRQRCLRT